MMASMIPPQKGIAFEMKKGQCLEVIDPCGQQVADLFCFSKADPKDALSAGRSIDYNDQLYMTMGHILYSQKSLPMFTILKDSCGRHDFLMTPCSLEMFHMVSGKKDYHPSCQENLVLNLKSFNISAESIGTTFNIFMNVSLGADGKIQVIDPISKAGDVVVLRAEMDLIVALTACSDEATNAGLCKPILYRVFDYENKKATDHSGLKTLHYELI